MTSTDNKQQREHICQQLGTKFVEIEPRDATSVLDSKMNTRNTHNPIESDAEWGGGRTKRHTARTITKHAHSGQQWKLHGCSTLRVRY